MAAAILKDTAIPNVMASQRLAESWFCIGFIEVGAEAHGALIGAVSGLLRPEDGWSLDLIRICASGAASDRQGVAGLRRALLPTSLDVFDLREGCDWMSGTDFLQRQLAGELGVRATSPRVVVASDEIKHLDEILKRRGSSRGVFLTDLGPWQDFFGGDLCMRLTKRWILMDDPTFRLEPVATFANFATTGKVDRAWVEWLLFEQASATRSSSAAGAPVATNLAAGLPIGRERVAAYLATLKRMLRG